MALEPHSSDYRASGNVDRPELPRWLAHLEEEDLHFLRRFLLTSGSLKDLAAEYGISYPTIRGRLDRLIAKVRAAEEAQGVDEFQQKLRVLVADGRLPAGLAKELLAAHRNSIARE